MSNASDRPTKAFSCIRCFERKVKCDKQNPCTNCAKSQVECVFRVPPPPRRRKKRLQEDALLERLRKCEDLLKSKGISVDGTPSTTESPDLATDGSTVPPNDTTDDFAKAVSHFDVLPQFPASKNGQLLVNQGKSRFIENNLWTSVANEVSNLFRLNVVNIVLSATHSSTQTKPLENTTLEMKMRMAPPSERAATSSSATPPPAIIFSTYILHLSTLWFSGRPILTTSIRWSR